ncbi:unnamed protein product [Rotaria magnacalcarata]
MINQLKKQLRHNIYPYEQTWKLLNSMETVLLIDDLKALVINKLTRSLLEKLANLMDNSKNEQIETMEEFLEEDTKSDLNSAIHALVGTKNEFGIYQSSNSNDTRQMIDDFIRNVNMNSQHELNKSLRQAIASLVENSSDKTKFPLMREYLRTYQQRTISITEDKNLLNEYADYLKEKQPAFNKNDIVLLAYALKKCVKVHCLPEEDQDSLILLNTYNEQASEIVHVLYLDNQFIRLSVRQLEKKSARCQRYHQILADVRQLKTSKEFEEYLTSEKYRLAPIGNEKPEENLDQDPIIQKISRYFLARDQQQVRLALKSIATEFPSKSQFFQSLKERFSIGYPSISHDILILFSMSMIHSNTSKQYFILYQWIIEAFLQSEWINELALLKFEQYLDKPYEQEAQLRSTLCAIPCKQFFTLIITKLDDEQLSFDLITLLEQMTTCQLQEDELTDLYFHLPLNQWSMKLKHLSFIHLVQQVIGHDDQIRLSHIIYYLYTLNHKSEVFVHQLLAIFQEKHFDDQFILHLMEKFYHNLWQFDQETIHFIRTTPMEQLNEIIAKNGNCFEGISNSDSSETERKFPKLKQIIEPDKYTSIKRNLNPIEMFLNKMTKLTNVSINQISEPLCSLTIEKIEQWSIQFKAQSKEIKLENLHEALVIIERAIHLCFPDIIALRDAQKLTIIAFILNDKNLLAQVSTGEGKSLIVASLVILKCLSDEKGDIVTSSPVLARRDAEENGPLYHIFGISVGHSADENLLQRRSAYEKQVVIIDENGQILNCQIQLHRPHLQEFTKDLQYLLKEIVEQQRQIEVPSYLKPFIKRHLLAWIHSALKALDMEEGRNYIIDADRSATKLDKTSKYHRY